MRHLRRTARLGLLPLAGILLALASPLAGAQDSVRFDEARHLEGYEECFYSEWSSLYRLGEFEELSGRMLTSTELLAVRERWAAERERVRAEIAALEADPARLFTFRFDRALARNDLLASLEWERVESFDPYLFLVQKGAAPAITEVVQSYASAFDQLRKRFEHDYVTPCGLARNPAFGRLAVVVLGDRETFVKYVERSSAAGHYNALSTYDKKLRAAVLCQDPKEPQRSPESRTRWALHAFAHVLEDAYSDGARGAPIESWSLEGLAAYLARSVATPAGDAAAPNPGSLRELAAALANTRQRWANYRTLVAMLPITDYNRIYAELRRRVIAEERAEPDYNQAVQAAFHQAALLIHFLHEAEGREYRPAISAFVCAQLRGRESAEAFEEAFAAVDVAALDRRFLEWVVEEHAKAWPAAKLDQAALLGTGAEAASAMSTGRAESVALTDPTVEERFGLALWRASRGATDDALATVRELLAREIPAELKPRLEREALRLERWSRLRDAYLDSLIRSKETLELEIDGQDVRVVPTEVREGRVLLAENRFGLREVELDRLPPHPLARKMGRDVSELAPGWVRIYGYVLGGDTRWKQLLKEDDAETEALREDAKEDYPERIRLGTAAALLNELAELPAPEDRAAAEALLERTRSLRKRFGDLALLDRKAGALRSFDERSLRVVFRASSMEELLAGSITELPEGRVRVLYRFDDPAELRDFRHPDPLPQRHGLMPKLLDGHENGFRIRDGALWGSGAAGMRHVLDFGAPLTVRYALSYRDPKVAGTNIWFFMLGFCYRDEGNFAWALNRQFLEAWSDRVMSRYEPPGNASMYTDSVYDMELRHDGARIRLTCNGEVMGSLSAGDITSGGLFLWLHSDLPVVLESLEIEGSVEPASLERFESAWVEGRLGD